MDFLLQVDPVHRVVLVTFGRVITKAVALAVHREIERLVELHGPCSTIADFSITVKSGLTPQFIRGLAMRSPAIPSGKQKLIVAPTPETYAIGRLFRLLQDETGDTMRIVYSLEEAYESMGLNSPEFRTIDSPSPEAGMAA